MAVTLTVMSVLLTVAATALFRMYRQQGRQLERIAQTAAWQRLARDFRDDVHATRSVSLNEDDTSRLILDTPDGTVVWLVHEDEIRRIQHARGATGVAASEVSADQPGERYVFPDASVKFSVVTETAQADIAVVRITPPAPPGSVPPPATALHARVSLDFRHSPPDVATSASLTN
jgi:type II secretory pathway pseudopilin PulG